MNNYIFQVDGFQEAHIYEFSESPYSSPYYKSSFDIVSGSRSIGIIDQFQGKRPIVLNKNFVVDKKQVDLQLVQTLILDSHIVDYLHRFMTGHRMDHESKQLVGDFIAHVSQINCDYSPVFYLTENWVKSKREQYLKTSADKLSSLLRLHSMREDAFVECRRVEYKAEALDYYFDLYKSNSFEGCGEAWAKSIFEYGGFDGYVEISRLSYVCLVKMVLIHFMNPEVQQDNVIRKYYEFERFLVEDLNLVLGRELVLALYYFSGLAGRFVGVQPNMKFDKAIRGLRSTAWDLLLLRMPEQLLAPSTLPEMNLSYVVTSEQKLYEVGAMFSLEKLFYVNPESMGDPVLSFNREIFGGILSRDAMKELEISRLSLSLERQEVTKGISSQKLSWLEEDLERQLKVLCSQ